MSIIKFQEYLNSKGKTIEKAGDILKPEMNKIPEKPSKYITKGKNYSFGAALNKEPNPYISKGISVSQGEDDEMGLGSLGTPNTDYSDTKSDVDSVSEINEHCGCEKKKAPFVVAYSSGSFHPDPIQAIKYIVYLTNENENILKALMHEARKTGCLNKYTDYLTRTPELYQSLQKKMQDQGAESIMQKLGLSTNEMTQNDLIKTPHKNYIGNQYEIIDKKRRPKKTRDVGDKVYEKGISDFESN